MFFRRMFIFFAFFLLIGGLFGFRGQRQYQNGYAQGYVAGQQAVQTALNAEDGGTAVSPPVQPVTPPSYHGFGFFGMLFKMATFFFGFMVFIAFMGLLFGKRHWHHGRGWHHARHWGKWHKEWENHKQGPYWYSDDDTADEPVMKA